MLRCSNRRNWRHCVAVGWGEKGMNKTNFMAAMVALLAPRGPEPVTTSLLVMPTRAPVREFRRPRAGWREQRRKRVYRELAYRRRRNARLGV